jgi:hypothetical protein
MTAKGGDNMPFEVIGGASLSALEPQIAELKKQGWAQRRIHSGKEIEEFTKSVIGLSCDGWSDKAKHLHKMGAEVIVIFEKLEEPELKKLLGISLDF